MTFAIRSAALISATLLALGASVGAVEAMPVAPVTAGAPAAGVEQVAYLHRHYPGYHSRSARRFRHARRNSPNRYCRNQPSRCR